MNPQQAIDYERIAKAITYIRENFRQQPTLEQVAAHVNLSPFHFQRLFGQWAGTTPKKFLQYISVAHAKQLLKEQQATLADAACATGLSGTGRLHDLFVRIEGMTPAEYRDGGRGLTIRYSFAESLFGHLIVASTSKGICYMAFYEQQEQALLGLKARFPRAEFVHQADGLQQDVLRLLQRDRSELPEVKLHLRGTDFQLKVWDALLKIPLGALSTYGVIAEQIGTPKASRAVGTAIGSNPVAFLIPCHRVIQSTGNMGGYMWGETRKAAIIGWESAQFDGTAY